MKRLLRRVLRQWKSEFMAVWLRLTAFHRIVLGMILAMGLVYASRVRVLDPLTVEVDALHAQLRDKGVPARVPTIEADDDLQQEQLRAESLRESLETWTRELAAQESESGLQFDAGESDAHAALLTLANRHGVRVHAKSPLPQAQGNAGRMAASAYTLRGRFPALFAFLSGLRDVPLLWEIQQVQLEFSGGSDGMSAASDGSVSPELNLRFHLVLHRYQEGER